MTATSYRPRCLDSNYSGLAYSRGPCTSCLSEVSRIAHCDKFTRSCMQNNVCYDSNVSKGPCAWGFGLSYGDVEADGIF